MLLFVFQRHADSLEPDGDAAVCVSASCRLARAQWRRCCLCFSVMPTRSSPVEMLLFVFQRHADSLEPSGDAAVCVSASCRLARAQWRRCCLCFSVMPTRSSPVETLLFVFQRHADSLEPSGDAAVCVSASCRLARAQWRCCCLCFSVMPTRSSPVETLLFVFQRHADSLEPGGDAAVCVSASCRLARARWRCCCLCFSVMPTRSSPVETLLFVFQRHADSLEPSGDAAVCVSASCRLARAQWRCCCLCFSVMPTRSSPVEMLLFVFQRHADSLEPSGDAAVCVSASCRLARAQWRCCCLCFSVMPTRSSPVETLLFVFQRHADSLEPGGDAAVCVSASCRLARARWRRCCLCFSVMPTRSSPVETPLFVFQRHADSLEPSGDAAVCVSASCQLARAQWRCCCLCFSVMPTRSSPVEMLLFVFQCHADSLEPSGDAAVCVSASCRLARARWRCCCLCFSVMPTRSSPVEMLLFVFQRHADSLEPSGDAAVCVSASCRLARAQWRCCCLCFSVMPTRSSPVEMLLFVFQRHADSLEPSGDAAVCVSASCRLARARWRCCCLCFSVMPTRSSPVEMLLFVFQRHADSLEPGGDAAVCVSASCRLARARWRRCCLCFSVMPTRSSPVEMPGGHRTHRLSSGGDIRCSSPQQDVLLIEAGQSPAILSYHMQIDLMVLAGICQHIMLNAWHVIQIQ